MQVLALRAGTQLQIFNLELRAKMKSYSLPTTETLIYWRWATPNIIALVTQTSVYHWSIEGDSAPQKLDKFDVPEGTQVHSQPQPCIFTHTKRHNPTLVY